MDFDTYKAWREDVLAQHQPQRFDCLNPFLAMDFTRRWEISTTETDPQEALSLWRQVHQAGAHIRWAPTGGVRSALSGLFAAAAQRGMELWLPQDVYPFYAQEAARCAPHIPLHRFQAFPALDATPLSHAGPSALLVITHPLSPGGRFLSPAETTTLAQWAAAGPDRWIVLDGVYLYANRLPRSFFPGFGQDRVLGLFSLSKSWLLRGVFGTIGGPTTGDDWWAQACTLPSSQAAGHAHAALTQDPLMPIRQRQIFQAEWQRRGWHLHRYATPTAGPGAGYFKPVHIDAETALRRDNILLVPASVFGSLDRSWSVATCLYEAKAMHA